MPEQRDGRRSFHIPPNERGQWFGQIEGKLQVLAGLDREGQVHVLRDSSLFQDSYVLLCQLSPADPGYVNDPIKRRRSAQLLNQFTRILSGLPEASESKGELFLPTVGVWRGLAFTTALTFVCGDPTRHVPAIPMHPGWGEVSTAEIPQNNFFESDAGVRRLLLESFEYIAQNQGSFTLSGASLRAMAMTDPEPELKIRAIEVLSGRRGNQFFLSELQSLFLISLQESQSVEVRNTALRGIANYINFFGLELLQKYWNVWIGLWLNQPAETFSDAIGSLVDLTSYPHQEVSQPAVDILRNISQHPTLLSQQQIDIIAQALEGKT